MADIQLATKTDLNLKVDKTQILTNVPVNAKFTDTVTTINGKSGAIAKADIVALGVPSQDTVYTLPSTLPSSMITGLPTSLPANGGNSATVGGFTVGVNVPANAKFTDTIYTHPSSHPASMITGLSAVATSGSYDDLSDTPNIPAQLTKISQLTNDTNFIDGAYDNSASGLTATTIKDAIDELKALFDTITTP